MASCSSPLLAYWSVLVTCAARAWCLGLPTQTSSTEDISDVAVGWTPKPTKAATHFGFMTNEKILLPRQREAGATCGWEDGSSMNPYICTGSSNFCVSTSTPGVGVGWWGCCDRNNCLSGAPITSCISGGDSRNVATTGSLVQLGPGVIYCPLSSPYCATTILVDFQDASYTQFGCDIATPSLVTVLPTTGSATSTSSTASLSLKLSSTTSVTSSNLLSSASPLSSSASSSSSDHTGAIAGGVVGAVVGLALIAGIIGYLVWKKRKERIAPLREVSQYSTGYNQSPLRHLMDVDR